MKRANKLKQQKMEIQKAKVDQRQLSKVLVSAFQHSVNTVVQEKMFRRGAKSETALHTHAQRGAHKNLSAQV